jgi:rubredoxin
MKDWTCMQCGFVYDEEEGLPEQGIPPGTKFEDLPDDWVCPDCGEPKAGFFE